MNKDRIIYELWKIIDNIDTIGDAAKGDDKGYRKAVEREQRKRWEFLDEKEVDRLYDRYHPWGRRHNRYLGKNGVPGWWQLDTSSRVQYVLWKVGIPIHNPFRDECTPDFACCINKSEKKVATPKE